MSALTSLKQNGIEAALRSGPDLSSSDGIKSRSVRPEGFVSKGPSEFQGALAEAVRTVDVPSGSNTKQISGDTRDSLAGLKFSSHALERIQTRGISFSANELERIENAIARAAQKGSKDTLVLAQDKAMIVSVKNKTVVTVMDRNSMRENVFTNIDSTVMV